MENIYKKRLRGYAQLGYTLAAQQQEEKDFQSIYSNEKYIKDLLFDIISTKHSLIICGECYSIGYVNQIDVAGAGRIIQYRIGKYQNSCRCSN